MVDLRLETCGLLLAKVQLKLDDLLLFAEVGDQGPKFRELSVVVIHRIPFAGLRSGGSCRLLDASGARAHRLQVVVKELILLVEIFAPKLEIGDFLVKGFALLLPAAFGTCELSLGGLGSCTSFPGSGLAFLETGLQLLDGLEGFSMCDDLLGVTFLGSLYPR